MEVYFTICSNNYLAYAKVLGQSLKKQNRDAIFFIFLSDEKHPAIDYALLADEVIPIASIEPNLSELSKKYNIIELSTAIKPTVFEYLFLSRNIRKAVFLDPDIKIFAPTHFLFTSLDNAGILLTPHIYTPVPFDGNSPSENTFLNFGLYNLGFIGLRHDPDTLKFLRWWKEHTYQQGYIDVYKGIFVDQLPINFAPIFFKNVELLFDKGLNMAPWNLHERVLTETSHGYLVNKDEPLKFYHFSSFDIHELKLPTQHYNRYTLTDRPDLFSLYRDYQSDLINAGHAGFENIQSVYSKEVKRISGLKKLFRKKTR